MSKLKTAIKITKASPIGVGFILVGLIMLAMLVTGDYITFMAALR